MVDVELGSYFMAPVSEPKLTNPEEVQEAIRGLKVSKAPGPNGIPNRALKHLPQRAVSLLVLIFNAILLTHHFPTAWKHARVISILKRGKDPTLPSSYRPISPLPVQFKALLHGQKGCVFFSGHLNLRTTPETGLPSREKNHNN